MFIDERSGSVILRDSPDAIRMAERLVASSISRAEVMLEVEVLEISSSRLHDLGSSTQPRRPSLHSSLGTGGPPVSCIRSVAQNSDTIRSHR